MGPVAVLAAAAAIALAAGCASSRAERHLAPFFTELSRAGGGTEFEALGGAVRVRRSRVDGPWNQIALRPLVIVDRNERGETFSHFLTPFGLSRETSDEYFWRLLPIARYQRNVTEQGEMEWTFLSLPGIYWARRTDGRTLRAVFPFGGVLEDFLSFDRLSFVLFPLYARAERGGRVTHNLLWPIFSVTRGETGTGWRIWPLYGRNRIYRSYDRTFAFWPIFYWQKNHLWAPPEKQETKWMVFPLAGHTRRAAYRSTSVLWPFFGWASDPTNDFWSWDGPWPLVRLLHDPQTGTFRTRFWPVYSHYHGDGLDSTWYLWPILNLRHEEYAEGSKDGLFVLPFWQSWTREDAVEGRSSFHKLWPLYQIERARERHSRTAFPALNPLWRTPEIDEMYAWIYELYTRERDDRIVRERSWLGIYRREKDEDEDRVSIAGLWSRRRHGPAQATTDTSVLFGLLRWRKTATGSLEWLPPAIPGPGWPLLREPRGP